METWNGMHNAWKLLTLFIFAANFLMHFSFRLIALLVFILNEATNKTGLIYFYYDVTFFYDNAYVVMKLVLVVFVIV